MNFSKLERNLKKHSKFKSAEFFKETVELLKVGMSGTKIKIDLQLGPKLNWMLADRGQLQQVLNNLVINSAQAIGASNGLIKIFARQKNTVAGEVPGLPAGKYVEVIVLDNGPGIPDAVLKNIFDPYFTTKSSGNGLGLASCRSIIGQHGGTIIVSSRTNYGATFKFYLRCLDHNLEISSSR
ncbi:MAG: hypothetical protein HN509_18745 [Halobacteriovoraceae bacterium]|nr:hypothetical protein [Halobacteriovoraceae bacterium]